MLQRLDLLDLPTLLFGWHEGWVDRAQVVGVAVDQLVATPGVDDPELAFLAGADDEDDEEIDTLLHRLAERSSPVSSEEIQRRWWLAHLDCLLRLGLEPEEQIQTAEQLWADLGYPPELEPLSPYYTGPAPPDPVRAPAELADALRSELTTVAPL